MDVERNLVVTVYDWLSPKYYLHDLTLTDRRKPTVNAYRPDLWRRRAEHG